MRTTVPWLPALLLASTLGIGCAGTTSSLPAYVDPAPHASGFVSVAPGLRLHYLDFGGSGDALVLLAGAGNSAHVFDSFAPLLTGHFHVWALTRRGFGESSQPASGYDTKSLAGDILAFLDFIGAPQADIVGHSIAGAEMTRFANDHPDRLEKLVYLDAAYDWLFNSEAKDLPSPPEQPQPVAADLSSPKAFAAYWARMEGVPLYPEADIRATWTFSDDGRPLAPVTPAAIATAVATEAAARHPDYAEVQAPALAIYTVPESIGDLFPWISLRPSEAQGAAAYLAAVQPLLAAQRDAFRAAIPRGTVIEMRGLPHYVFLLEPEAAAKSILDFLLQ
jgi:non-heme chloroperoxidase